MSLDCELVNNEVNEVNQSLNETKLNENELRDKTTSKFTKTVRESLSSAPAKKRIKLEQHLIDNSRSSSFSSFTPSPSPKDDQLNDSLIKENILKDNCVNENNLKENYAKDNNHLKDIQQKDNQKEFLNKSKSAIKLISRPETPPSTELKNDHLNTLLQHTPHPHHSTSSSLNHNSNNLPNLPNLSQLTNSNALINQNLLTTLQHQQHHQFNNLAQLYSAGNAAAHLLSPNSMKNLKFSIDNILQQKPEQLKNSKFLQENKLSKLHLQLQQHHLQLQKQHMQFKFNQTSSSQSNQANQSKSPLDENNESNDSTNFNSSVLNSTMVEESKNNLSSIWPGWAYCRSYADPASGKSFKDLIFYLIENLKKKKFIFLYFREKKVFLS